MNYGYNGMLRCLANLNKKQRHTKIKFVLEFLEKIWNILNFLFRLHFMGTFGVVVLHQLLRKRSPIKHIISQYHQEIWCGRHKLDCKRTASKMNYVGSL